MLLDPSSMSSIGSHPSSSDDSASSILSPSFVHVECVSEAVYLCPSDLVCVFSVYVKCIPAS